MRNDLSDYEEKERQAATIENKEGKGEVEVRISEPTSLLDAYVESINPPKINLAAIAENHDVPVVSLYLSFTPDKLLRERKMYLTHFNSMRAEEEAKRKEYIHTLSHRQQKRLNRDLDDLHTYLEHYFNPENSRSLVIFKSGEELNHMLRLPTHTFDRLVIDVNPLLRPLKRILETQQRVLIVDVSKEEAIFYRYYLGDIAKIDKISSFVPSETVDKSIPKKAQRHRRQHLNWHFTEVATKTEELFRGGGYDYVMLTGPDQQQLKVFAEELPLEITNNLLGAQSMDISNSIEDLRLLIQGMLEQDKEEVEEDALNNLGNFQAQSMIVSGLPHVIESQNRSFVRKLYVTPELQRKGYVCLTDHQLSLTPGKCQLCGRMMTETRNVVDELIELALSQNQDILVIEKNQEKLEPFEGIVGVTYKL